MEAGMWSRYVGSYVGIGMWVQVYGSKCIESSVWRMCVRAGMGASVWDQLCGHRYVGAGAGL